MVEMREKQVQRTSSFQLHLERGSTEEGESESVREGTVGSTGGDRGDWRGREGRRWEGRKVQISTVSVGMVEGQWGWEGGRLLLVQDELDPVVD